MSVQWFPGHMTKAIRNIKQMLPAVDMVIECRDARIVESSHNPLIDEVIKDKPRLIVLTKKDLANPLLTEQWHKKLEIEGAVVISLNVLKDNVAKKIEQGCLLVMKEKQEKDLRRGIKPRIIRAMIMGVPNVGKSTIINRAANKKVNETANRPGVTQSLKRVKVSDTLEIVDSPGLLWPRFENQEQGMNLALCLSVKETGFEVDQVIAYGLKRLSKDYKNKIVERYQVEDISDIEQIKKNIVRITGKQENDGSMMVLRDIQNHVFGRFTWDEIIDDLQD
ncbi:MAG: ribosome biogenesis GTPase YlqF [Erysipelothrix sp.]|nr:ribosome biogenesis GTPase YlqF [Erysipelothrix sp.]